VTGPARKDLILHTRRISRSQTFAPAPKLVTVYDGRHCIGLVISRRMGFEAFDHDERPLGIFATVREAAAAIPAKGAAS
jgi:hypothetical protein